MELNWTSRECRPNESYTIAIANALQKYSNNLDQILRSFPNRNKPILPDGFYVFSLGLIFISTVALITTLPVIMHAIPSIGLFIVIISVSVALCGILTIMDPVYDAKRISYEKEISREKIALINGPSPNSSQKVDVSCLTFPSSAKYYLSK